MADETIDFFESVKKRLEDLNGKSAAVWQQAMKNVMRFPEWDKSADITLFYTIPQILWEYNEGLGMTIQEYYDLHSKLNSELHSACQSAFLQVFSTHAEEMKKQGANLNYQLEFSHSLELIKRTMPPEIKSPIEKHLRGM